MSIVGDITKAVLEKTLMSVLAEAEDSWRAFSSWAELPQVVQTAFIAGMWGELLEIQWDLDATYLPFRCRLTAAGVVLRDDEELVWQAIGEAIESGKPILVSHCPTTRLPAMLNEVSEAAEKRTRKTPEQIHAFMVAALSFKHGFNDRSVQHHGPFTQVEFRQMQNAPSQGAISQWFSKSFDGGFDGYQAACVNDRIVRELVKLRREDAIWQADGE